MPTRAQEFLKTIAADATLRQNLENAPTPEARRHVIDVAGFTDVSKEDIAATLKKHDEIIGDLSDAELEAVAGGETSEWIALSIAVSRASVVVSEIVSEVTEVTVLALF
jgi:predicted ribosomally synthesized peptide with nif11-like leader